MSNCHLQQASRWTDSQYLKMELSDKVSQTAPRIALTDASTLFQNESTLARNMAKKPTNVLGYLQVT